MKTVIISVTEKGRILSEKISRLFTAERYCYIKHTDDNAAVFDDIRELTGRIFPKYDIIIFICAAGIAVRAIAPYILSKLTDPAVVVIDDCGKYVIPILSGHIGGANRAAKYIARETGAEAVITTATDIGGHFSPDSMAAANGLIIDDMDTAKRIAAAVLEGSKIGLKSSYECINLPPEITYDNAEYGICIDDNFDEKSFPVTLGLMPKNIILGLGCKRGTSADTIENCVETALGSIDKKRICAIATIDIKADEPAMLEYSRRLGVPLYTYSAEELMKAEGEFTSSEYVRSVTGTDNVCERSAVCCGGTIIVKKTALNGVTAAIAKKEIIIDFAREV